MKTDRLWGAASAFAIALGAGACSSNDTPAGNLVGAGGSSVTGGTGASGGTSGTNGAAGNSSTGTGGTAMASGGGGGSGPGAGGGAGTGLTGGNGAGGSTAGVGAGGRPGLGGAPAAGGGRPTGGQGGLGAGGSGGAMQGMGGAVPSGGTGPMGDATFSIQVELASDEKPTAPTTVGIVTWSVTATGITSAHIDFGLDTTYGMTAPVDLTAKDYRTLLLGMKPAKTYHFHVVASDGSKTYTSDDQTVTTGAKVSANLLSSFSVKDASKLPKGFFITSFWQGSNSKMPFIFDTDGDVVWWYTANSGESSDGVSQAKMSADSQSMWLVNEGLNGAPLRRVTMDGLMTQTYSNAKSSHAVAAVTGDTMVYLDYSSGMSGCNDLYEINNAGTTKLIWKPTNPPLKLGSFPTCHANAVRYSKKEDVYTYSDWQQDVVVLDRSGTVQWTLAGKVQGGNGAWGGAQHGHQLLDNSMLIFANNGGGNNQSAAIEYGLDGSLIKKFTSKGSATNFGDVQRLSNGNTIITYSTSSLMQEVDASDQVVLEVKGSGSFGYVEFRESLYGLPIDIQQ